MVTVKANSHVSHSSPPRAARERVDSVLAKNLVAARVVAGITQSGLAGAAGISRATVAQIETGCSDPRLSTVADLAEALGIPTIFLLVGAKEVSALSALTSGSEALRLHVPEGDLARMCDYVASGLLKDRLRAARFGALLARNACPRESVVLTGVLSAILPGDGTRLGAALGERLASAPRRWRV